MKHIIVRKSCKLLQNLQNDLNATKNVVNQRDLRSKEISSLVLVRKKCPCFGPAASASKTSYIRRRLFCLSPEPHSHICTKTQKYSFIHRAAWGQQIH